MQYDTLGNVIGYTDADGVRTTTTYTIDGRVATRFDGKGTYAFTWDGLDANGKIEHRGLLTSLDVDILDGDDVFSAAYDEAGQQVVEQYPNLVMAETRYDNVGGQKSLSYSHAGSSWFAYQASYDARGRMVSTEGGLGSQRYRYDDNDRLLGVDDEVDGQCQVRAYSFDKNGNRTSLSIASPNSDGTCQTSAQSSVTSTYDEFDRNVDTGYAYDKFGRTTALPSSTGGGNVYVGYRADDMAANLRQGSNAKKFTFDAVRRPRQVLDTANQAETRRIVNHYADGGDSPAWIATSLDAGNSWNWVRNIVGIDGGLVGSQSDSGTLTIYLANLHGDIVAEVPNDTSVTAPSAYREYTEYGLPRSGVVGQQRYGWLGSQRRSSDALGGLMLMGARLYNANTGRFPQMDSVVGGNENSYNYPNDPINRSDTTGRCDPRRTTLCSAYHDALYRFIDVAFDMRDQIMNKYYKVRKRNCMGSCAGWL